MAVSRPIKNAPVTEEERTWRANIETPANGDYSIQVFREVIQKDAQGKVVSTKQLATPIQRKASAIAGESVKIGTKTVTAASVLEALPAFFDKWAEEDLAKAAGGAP